MNPSTSGRVSQEVYEALKQSLEQVEVSVKAREEEP